MSFPISSLGISMAEQCFYHEWVNSLLGEDVALVGFVPRRTALCRAICLAHSTF